MRCRRENLLAFACAVLFFLVGCGGVAASRDVYHLDTTIERQGSRARAHLFAKSVSFSARGDSGYVLDY